MSNFPITDATGNLVTPSQVVTDPLSPASPVSSVPAAPEETLVHKIDSVKSTLSDLAARVTALETAHLVPGTPDTSWREFVAAVRDDLNQVKLRIWGN